MSETATQAYVLGFLFTPNRHHVVVLEKAHPEWQRGRLNGIGGKIEAGEEPWQAMDREAGEEIGLSDLPWEHYATMAGNNWTVHVFRAFHRRAFCARQCEDEAPDIAPVGALPSNVLPNLHWLIPLALDNELIGVQRLNYAEQANADLKAQAAT